MEETLLEFSSIVNAEDEISSSNIIFDKMEADHFENHYYSEMNQFLEKEIK